MGESEGFLTTSLQIIKARVNVKRPSRYPVIIDEMPTVGRVHANRFDKTLENNVHSAFGRRPLTADVL